VRGQESAKRAVELAAAGGHPLLLVGPGGAGKTLLARCLPGLLPAAGAEEEAEIAAAYRRAGEEPPAGRPVRSSGLGLTAKAVGRELALAGYGTLLLDDLPALRPATLRALAQALDRGGPPVQVVATMRPCPCGHAGDRRRECTCTPREIRRYRARVEGPLAHRFDVCAEVPAVTIGELRGRAGEPSEHVAARVVAARAIQTRRGGRNAALGPAEVDRCCPLERPARQLLDAALERRGLSAVGLHRVLRVARTLADLAGADEVRAAHVAAAVQYQTPVAGW
jgi:magnesium chelatase family protein